jgi:hypothetical protein
MKLHLINDLLHQYSAALVSGKIMPDSLFRLCTYQWKQSFDLEDGRISEIIDKSLKNDLSGRLWGGENYSIKSGLISLAAINEDLFRENLRDLFNEKRQLIMRVNRFIHHCDVILEEKERKKTEVHTHYQSYYSACLLLSLEYPNIYCLYNFQSFELFCKRIGHHDIPIETDLERYYKILKIINGIVSKDNDFMHAYYSKLPDDIYLGPALDVCYNFVNYTTSFKEDV